MLRLNAPLLAKLANWRNESDIADFEEEAAAPETLLLPPEVLVFEVSLVEADPPKISFTDISRI